MNRTNIVFATLTFATCFLLLSTINFKKEVRTGKVHHTPQSILPVWHPQFQTTFVEPYESSNDDVDINSVQCPIPKEDREFNHTGTQCVFSTIQTIGGWADHEILAGEKPITSLPDCQTYSNPSHAGSVLEELGVKFTQTYQSKEAGLMLIQKCMLEGRGCLFSIPGHAMTLVHYDEEADRVCFIDNSDRNLRIQETNTAWFDRQWTGWVLAVYRVPDLIPRKNPPAKRIPIYDSEGKLFPNGYFISPGSEAIPLLDIAR